MSQNSDEYGYDEGYDDYEPDVDNDFREFEEEKEIRDGITLTKKVYALFSFRIVNPCSRNPWCSLP